MDWLLATLAGGFLLGLAGSFHCACMCGAIASGALFMTQPKTHRDRLVSLAFIQSGRILTYSILGGVVASIASIAVDPTLTATSYRLVQWLGAVVLMAVGLSMAGLLPRPALALPGTATVSGWIEALKAPLARHSRLGPLTLGLSWGMTPCPMVYAALLSAALTGSFAGGFLWMLAFGAGTLPGVVSAALGASALLGLRKVPMLSTAAGLALAFFGFATVYFDWHIASPFCLGQ